MGKHHGRNSSLTIIDAAGASMAFSPQLNSTVLAWSRNNPDVTTYGYDTVQRISGLRDYTLTLAGIWDGSGSMTVSLDDLMSGSIITLVKWYPAGSQSTGCPFFTGCMLLSAYSENGPGNGPVATTATFQAAAGSLSASTT